jgi:hypothetical protein
MSPREWPRGTVYSILITIGILVLSYWAHSATRDWSATASIIQAGVAVVLVWTTWSSISRSDKQIDKSQEQISLSEEQLRISTAQTDLLREQVDVARAQIGDDSEPTIIVTIDPFLNYKTRKVSISIANLSRFPIYISAVLLHGRVGSSRNVRLRLMPSKKSLQSAESTEMEFTGTDTLEFLFKHIQNHLINCEESERYNDILREPAYLEGPQWFPFDLLRIEFYYAPLGRRPYSHEYEFSLFSTPPMNVGDEPWEIRLRQSAFERQVGDGSWLPLYRFNSGGDRRPL